MTRVTKCKILAFLKPGAKLTLVFQSARGGIVRKHRTVLRVVGDRVYTRVDHDPTTRERVTRIVLSGEPEKRFYLLSWGFMIVSGSGVRSIYVWGHHT
jgi:hypothetical protein